MLILFIVQEDQKKIGNGVFVLYTPENKTTTWRS